MSEKNQKTFEVHGTLKMGTDEKNFTKKVMAHNQKNAIERVFTLFGSKNKLKRKKINVKEVKQVE